MPPISSGLPPAPDAAGTPGERLKLTRSGSSYLRQECLSTGHNRRGVRRAGQLSLAKADVNL